MATKPLFKYGDLVRVIDKSSIFYGELGFVRGHGHDGKGEDWRYLLHMEDVPGTPELPAEAIEKYRH